MKLEGRKAVVTGGSRGIGRAIALELARERADVSDFPDTFRMAQEVLGALGDVDLLVNNAGISSDKTFVKMDHASWRKVLAINLDGVFNCTKVFVDSMLKRNYGR